MKYFGISEQIINWGIMLLAKICSSNLQAMHVMDIGL
jgi:hypothetical protein